MGKNLLSAILSLAFLVGAISESYAGARYAVANGRWNATTTWSATNGGTPGASIPVITDTVYIANGLTVTIDKQGANVNFFCAALIVGTPTTGGIINIGDNAALNIIIDGGLTLTHGKIEVVPGPGQRSHIMTIGGNLFVDTQGTLDMLGTNNQDICKVVLNGSALQTVGGPGVFILRDFDMNNIFGARMDRNLTIDGNFSFIAGTFDLNGFDLIVTGNTPGGSSTNYFITDAIGSSLTNQVVSAATTFPIGTATRYLPVVIAPGAGTPDYTVQCYVGATMDGVQGTQTITDATGNKSDRVDAVWNISASVATSSTVQLGWTQDDLEGTNFVLFSNNLIGISDYSAGAWQNALADVGTANNGTNVVSRTLTIPTTFLPLSVGRLNETLPVRLANFSAVAMGSQVKLNWSALTTHLNSSFDIERSANGSSFTKLGKKSAAIVGEAKYEFVDAAPLAGNNYYRIKSTDENGKVSYSKSLLVRTGSKTFALNNLFPSVTTGNLNLVISSSVPRTAQVNFVDINGRVANSQILSIGAGNNNYSFNVNQLPAGLYTMVIFSQEERLESRFIKQ